LPISINKNSESGARIRYATFFNVRQCQTDESWRWRIDPCRFRWPWVTVKGGMRWVICWSP